MEGHLGLSDSNTIFPFHCVVILSAINNDLLFFSISKIPLKNKNMYLLMI